MYQQCVCTQEQIYGASPPAPAPTHPPTHNHHPCESALVIKMNRSLTHMISWAINRSWTIVRNPSHFVLHIVTGQTLYRAQAEKRCLSPSHLSISILPSHPHPPCISYFLTSTTPFLLASRSNNTKKVTGFLPPSLSAAKLSCLIPDFSIPFQGRTWIF
jgi:hypothetical protein